MIYPSIAIETLFIRDRNLKETGKSSQFSFFSLVLSGKIFRPIRYQQIRQDGNIAELFIFRSNHEPDTPAKTS
ncbi:MAG: hypothetical protein LIO64_08025 [Akkermansia sp.]|nr:hypothetical protein [Akkermansia sp.]